MREPHCKMNIVDIRVMVNTMQELPHRSKSPRGYAAKIA